MNLEEVGFRSLEEKLGTGARVRRSVNKWICDDRLEWRKLTKNAKINDTKVVLSLPKFDRILASKTLGSGASVSEDLEQTKRVVSEAAGRIIVNLYWKEVPASQAASGTRCDDDGWIWDDFVALAEAGAIDDKNPTLWEDGVSGCRGSTH